jgi:hypothetical protein
MEWKLTSSYRAMSLRFMCVIGLEEMMGTRACDEEEDHEIFSLSIST